ncbi:hypothetical protein P0082_03060 [Candidatus Haliotispira prima]|uniref:Uncharacterized protein n=1 Tax=Candidatus Haliotispira prima TaxID=3034016 RepID=A0ABY8MIL2_9SPIO|nr:hypothetical protein P0082_03060 [Candidatus Haliotispira prima]
MESKLYALLNNLLNPKKFPVALSLAAMFSIPAILEVFLIGYYLKDNYSMRMILTLESLSVLVGYAYLFLLIKVRIYQSLNHYKEKRIYRLIGSFPAIIYMLIPGMISLLLGIILLTPLVSKCIGRKIIQVSHIDPNIIYTLLELNNAK